MRIPFIVGNWKMNTTVAEAVYLMDAMVNGLEDIQGVEIAVCPPFVSIFPLYEMLRGGNLLLGAQTMDFHDSGAYTGEVSPLMLAPLCQTVILGHSERRQYYGETDTTVSRKLRAALQYRLMPIVCVGENLEEHEAGQCSEVILRQLAAAFEGITEPKNTVIAYEPLWAIGTGQAADGLHANETISTIRQAVYDRFGAQAAGAIRILYGGSVTAANIAEFISQPEIDGALVGSASLKDAEFIRICQITSEIKVPPELRQR